MRTFLLPLATGLLLVWSAPAQAQGPTIDPAFTPGEVLTVGFVEQAFQQADGKRVLLGSFTRVAGQAVDRLTRLDVSGTRVDAGFQASIAGLQGSFTRLFPLSGGKLLLYGSGTNNPLQLGSVVRNGLLRLNADGTPDPTFDLGSLTATFGPQLVVEQPDGKLLVAGYRRLAGGGYENTVLRLQATGAQDPTFAPPTLGGTNAFLYDLALQADGKVLLAGRFNLPAAPGIPQQGLARLLPDGSPDASYAPALPARTTVFRLTLQPDGKLLVVPASGGSPLLRLLPTGAADPAWQPGTGFVGGTSIGAVAVQPDGRIVVASNATAYNGTPTGRLVRLTSSGSLDPTFANQTALLPPSVNSATSLLSLQVLPNGQLLTGGAPLPYGSPAALPTTLAVLDAGGVRLPAAAPPVRQPGSINTVVRQPNGQLLVGGDFQEVNGREAGYLARLNTDGTPDATFTTACNDVVHTLALQSDGKLVLGGRFRYVAGQARASLTRLLPGGGLDAGFVPATQPSLGEQVTQLAVQPDGNILLAGYFSLGGSPTPRRQARVLGSTGQPDFSFVPADPAAEVSAWHVLPNGNILAGGQSTQLLPGATDPVLVWRMLPGGSLDFSFSLTAVSTSTISGNTPTALATDPAGRIYVGRRFASYGTLATQSVARLLPNGTPDASFVVGSTSVGTIYGVSCLTVQPNGRLLVGVVANNPTFSGLLRLLPSGQEDLSFQPTSGPTFNVWQVLVQPDGALVVVGDFIRVSGLPITGIVRLLDSNVLSVRPQPANLALEAWPVPAHGRLHLRLDAAAQPQRVQLLDALGRTVLSQETTQPELTLNTAPLPPGTYLLRVRYATGRAASRRVVLE